jgi:hypothetical protein
MSRGCSKYRRNEDCIQGFGGKAKKKMITRKV